MPLTAAVYSTTNAQLTNHAAAEILSCPIKLSIVFTYVNEIQVIDPSMYVHQIVGEYQSFAQSFYKMNKMDIKIFHNCENFNKCNLQSSLRVNYYLIKF